MKLLLRRITAAIIVLVMVLTLMPGLKIDSKAAEEQKGYLVKFETVETSICSANSIYLTFHNDSVVNDWNECIPFAGSNFKRAGMEILDRLGFDEGTAFDTTKMPNEIKLIDDGCNIEIKSIFENKSIWVKKGEVSAEIKVTSYSLRQNGSLLNQYISNKNNGIAMAVKSKWSINRFLQENGVPFTGNDIEITSDTSQSGSISKSTGPAPKYEKILQTDYSEGEGTFTGTLRGNAGSGFWGIDETAFSIECEALKPVTFSLNGGTVEPYSLKDVRNVLPGSVYMPNPKTYTGDGKERKLLGWDTDKNAEEPKYKPGTLAYIKESTTLYAIYEQKEPINRVAGVVKVNVDRLPYETYKLMPNVRLEFDFGDTRAIAFVYDDGKFSLDTNYSGKATVTIYQYRFDEFL